MPGSFCSPRIYFFYSSRKESCRRARLAERLKPDLTIVGPDAPLVARMRNKFECGGVRLVGPSVY
jgi:phosphoribosylamine-glycine ligase